MFDKIITRINSKEHIKDFTVLINNHHLLIPRMNLCLINSDLGVRVYRNYCKGKYFISEVFDAFR